MVNRKFWGGDPESRGQIDSLLPEGPVIIGFCYTIMFRLININFNWKLIRCTMVLISLV